MILTMRQFEFIITNSKSVIYDWFAFFIVLLNTIAVGSALFFKTVSFWLLITGATALALGLLFLIVFFIKRSSRIRRLLFMGNMLSLGLYWMNSHIFWLGLILIVTAMLYTIAQRKFAITVTKEWISYPTFPPLIIQWNELNGVLLKDGILTIDFRNDKLIQHEITEMVNEQDFNEFCNGRLRSANEAGS